MVVIKITNPDYKSPYYLHTNISGSALARSKTKAARFPNTIAAHNFLKICALGNQDKIEIVEV